MNFYFRAMSDQYVRQTSKVSENVYNCRYVYAATNGPGTGYWGPLRYTDASYCIEFYILARSL